MGAVELGQLAAVGFDGVGGVGGDTGAGQIHLGQVEGDGVFFVGVAAPQPRSTTTTSPVLGFLWELVIKDFRGRPEIVPRFLERFVGLRDGPSRGQAVCNQVAEQVRQRFLTSLRFLDQVVVVGLVNPNRVGDGLHAYHVSTASPRCKSFPAGISEANVDSSQRAIASGQGVARAQTDQPAWRRRLIPPCLSAMAGERPMT